MHRPTFLRACWGLAALVWVVAAPAFAQDRSAAPPPTASSSAAPSPSRPVDPFDKPILGQPFDKQPFRQVRVPAWVEETIGCGYTLSAMDSAARTRAAQAGVTISELGFVDPFYAYYDSKLLKRRSPHVPLERLQHDLAEYERLGVKVLGVYPPCLQAEVYENHPDWRRVPTDTREIPSVDLQQHPYGGMLCLLGPYGDFFIEVMAEILTLHPQVAAFSFDGLHYGGVCYCGHCRDNYRRETGKEIPPADMNDPAFRRYQHWADRRMEDCVRRLQARIKGIKPDVALVTWTTNAGRFGHFLSIPRNMPARMNLLLDAPDQEFWLDETNRGATIVPALANAYIWAVTNHRVAFSEPYLMSHGNPYGKDSFPPEEILRRMLLAATHGASPSIAVAQPAFLQEELYDCLKEVQARRPWLTHKRPEPWCALLLSDNTRNFYGRSAGQVEERYLANVLGAFRAAQEEHLPVAIINDWNLNAEDLAPYQVLWLPNAACLDEAQCEAVRQFVQQGGGLVASLDTSLFDEFGDVRENFALADLLGVDFRGPASIAGGEEPAPALDENFARSIGPDYWEKRKSVFDFRQDPQSYLNQGRMRTYLADSRVVFKGPAAAVAVRPGESVAVGFATQRDRPEAKELPAVVTRQYGKGKVVYQAAGFDAAYYLYPYPYQRLVLAHSVRWAAAAPPPIQIKAPMCVQSSCFRQKRQGERLVVHLFNDANTTAFHALPDEDVPLREETLPVHDVRVFFSGEYRLKQIRLAPGGQELNRSPVEGGWEVVVPRLDVHAMVVAELEPDGGD